MWWTALLGGIPSAVSGFFGLKKAQADAITSAIDTIGESQGADANYARAAARSIESLYQAGPPIERLWRPTAMWIILTLIVLRWFGIEPGGLSEEEVNHIYSWFEIGLIGYMPLRSMDKWMRGFQIGSILKTFIEKKVL